MASDYLIHADCLTALADLPEATAHLIYLDPPFNTKVKRDYDDNFGSPQDYVAYMRPRLVEMARVLTPNGSLLFHCDWRASHYVKLMLDEVFDVATPQKRMPKPKSKTQDPKPARGVFVNEIIWHYGLGAARAKRQLLTKHDVIFWYAKSPNYTFNMIRGEPTKAMLAKYCHIAEDGRRYMMSYGRKYYLQGGKPLDDVWAMPSIAATSGERTGYPTQKPLALLQRIINLASNPNEVVLDPFCGSGTTVVAAKQLGRGWIGIDQSAKAIETAKGRIEKLKI